MLGLAALSPLASGAEISVNFPARSGDFPLFARGNASDIVMDPADFKVVQIAAGDLADDIQRVTGKHPTIRSSAANASKNIVLVGTLGHSALIDSLVTAGKIDPKPVAGKWESYLVTTVASPMPGIDSALVIAGSDRRGTAYGIFELSEKIGVSPWYWWADVPVKRQDTLSISAKSITHGSPSVKYRGIFLNDEDFGLQPWAAKTLEADLVRNAPHGGHQGKGDIGPKTYAHIFELLLRLKANFIWPAMHESTQAFNLYSENKQVADDYAIVMGSSHCEPMLRNGVTEWGHANEPAYNYVTNRDEVLNYWKQRVQENGKFENVYTLGMRGIHDSNMAGGGTTPERAARLSQIITDQRQLIHDIITPNVSTVPQIFCPYKEVLLLYQAGCIPPDDVTLVWADDNHGYIRQLSTPEEQKRAGGGGVYYHLSYWGAPHDYLWLCTIPPALMWEELSKANDYNDRTLWVVNVGDLKPGEIDINFLMNYAYDTSSYTIDNIQHYLTDFAADTFGPQHAGEIAALLKEYYHLNYQRKPEHLGFNTSQNPQAPINPTDFSNEEITARLLAFASLMQKTETLYAELPADQKDAFYELVKYPVRCSALQNFKILYADLNRRAAAAGDAEEAASHAERSRAAYEQIQAETNYYNNTLAGGKWKFMMSADPHNQDVFHLPKYAMVSPKTAATAPAPASTQPVRVIKNLEAHFVEQSRCLSLAAEHFTRRTDRNGAGWKVIPDLGREGSSMAVFPTTTPSVTEPAAFASSAPSLEYDFQTITDDQKATVIIQAIPTHRINPQRGLRYAVAVDSDPPQIIDLETPEFSETWGANVLRAAAFGTTTHNIPAGKHTLHIYMVDPGVVVDHITIDLGGLPRTYLPPAETVAAK